MAWSDHVDQLLYDGERKQRRLEFADATVVVTTHRVLVFAEDDGGVASPSAESEMGAAYRAIDRPNVRGVTVETGGSTSYLLRALGPGLLGGGLVAVGTFLEATELVPGLNGADSADGPGAATDVTNGVFDAVETVLSAVELATVLLGALALAAAVCYLALYLRSRSRRIALRISGGEDVQLPITDADIEAGIVSELEAAIQPGTDAEDADPITVPSADSLEERDAGGRGVDGPADLEPGAREDGFGPGGDPDESG
ncbi:hypothetical protein [Halopiger aswanensis]|uniref:Uncharacterized protein n=1 Tax=Halopiger aswanensis TaxID=148449 RepID=A0A3R7GUC9_9EURY|nr:hypothetical protein [Halopiger aswanensis]RKD93554.1 hypothetical protein ATJ93_3184 [Halopiger aswanensis]